MKPVIGPARSIIQQAISLGILCRPDEPGWSGEALKPDGEYFEHVIAASNHFVGFYRLKPGQILRDWELTTKEIITEEFDRDQKPPF